MKYTVFFDQINRTNYQVQAENETEAESKADKENLLDFFSPDYREPFICPFHNCTTDKGWCWECAFETYGYDEAKRIHDKGDK